MTASGPPAAPTRRGLLGGCAAALGGAGAAALLAGCGASGAHVAGPIVAGTRRRLDAPVARADVAILTRALALERRTVAAYTAGIPRLPHPEVVWARAFLSEELQHTGELIALIRAAGSKAPPPAASYDIGDPADAPGVLAGLDALEALQISSYLAWLGRLSPGPMRARVATILCSDAQHITALRRSLGRPALTSAFVGGVPRGA